MPRPYAPSSTCPLRHDGTAAHETMLYQGGCSVGAPGDSGSAQTVYSSGDSTVEGCVCRGMVCVCVCGCKGGCVDDLGSAQTVYSSGDSTVEGCVCKGIVCVCV